MLPDDVEAICYKIKNYTIQECEPPWKLVAFKDPIEIDHLAMTLFNGTDLNIGLNIVTSEKVFRNFNLLTENNDCTAFKPFNNAISVNLCAFVIARTNTDYYEVHFHNTSKGCSEHVSTYYYACSKTVRIVNASQESASSPTNETIISPTSMVTPTAGIDMLIIIVIIAAGAINVLIILVITTCCCYYKQKYHKKSLLISGSMKYTNRSLPTPAPEATYKPSLSECGEYAYPTLPTFLSRPSNKQPDQDESSAYMLSNAPLERMDDDCEYMGLGETVNEHRQKSILTVKRRKHQQRQNRNVSSYLEVEDVSETNNLNPQGPIAHTYADLDSTTQCNSHEVGATTHHTTNQKQESNCYMDLDDAARTPNRHMDVSVYKDLHGHIIPSGCNRKGCQECKSARMNQTTKHSSFNHDKSTESPLYQEVEQPVFYMAVEGKSKASCEIGHMAKCFDDNTYSFLT
ncbi:uncharacterized protein [Antedon mediterranea]|uniref:uncharacterized protein isoform X2 n=1 Tax=Antedon mediterranea TaxID=105859 RepID=UPI003AF7F7D6